MSEIFKDKQKQTVTMEGMMTLGTANNGLRYADFVSCEQVEIETLISNCKVHIMRDGNIYVLEKPKRERNHPVFREDNMSLSHGKDGYWYGSFRIAEQELALLPMKLTKQSASLAKKVKAMLDAERKLG